MKTKTIILLPPIRNKIFIKSNYILTYMLIQTANPITTWNNLLRDASPEYAIKDANLGNLILTTLTRLGYDGETLVQEQQKRIQSVLAGLETRLAEITPITEQQTLLKRSAELALTEAVRFIEERYELIKRSQNNYGRAVYLSQARMTAHHLKLAIDTIPI